MSRIRHATTFVLAMLVLGGCDASARPGASPGQLSGEVSLSWSPTGDWIGYSRNSGTTAVQSIVRPDGSEERVFSAEDGSRGVWSPDGKHLLVRRGDEGREVLWIVDLEGNSIGQVTDEPATYHGYWWGPASE